MDRGGYHNGNDGRCGGGDYNNGGGNYVVMVMENEAAASMAALTGTATMITK
ncbi:hypothetical protein F2Q70_00010733 [Brassica cretica]|uniref:Uncharacterized protein n=1 Tax=Brassica cretica TaxID=69181 RepID=A0A8S9M900_BRACR|nr:hypothetical protein F2Q70_00010733 [Brassica cretica]